MNYFIDSSITENYLKNLPAIDYNLVNLLSGKIKEYFSINFLNRDFYLIKSKKINSDIIRECNEWNMPETFYSVDKFYLQTNKITTIPQIKFIPLFNLTTQKWQLRFQFCDILEQPNFYKYFIYSPDEKFDTTIKANFDIFSNSQVFNKEKTKKSLEEKNYYIFKNIENEIIELELLINKYKNLKQDYLK